MVQFIGLDVHRKETVARIYHPMTQEERYQTIPAQEDQLAAFLKNQPLPGASVFIVSKTSSFLLWRFGVDSPTKDLPT